MPISYIYLALTNVFIGPTAHCTANNYIFGLLFYHIDYYFCLACS